MPLMRKRGRPSTFYTFENGRSRKQTKIIKVEDTKLHVPPIPDVIEEQKIETEPEPTSSTSTDIEEVSGYTKAKTQRLENWGGIYKKLVAVGLEQNAVTELTCNDCGINTIDLFRCIDCISTPVLCFDCLEERHKHPHLHIFEKWMHGTFFGYSPPTAPWKIKIHADCERSYLKELVIVDEKGRQHLRTVQFCTCEEEAETLLRFNLWASSPKHPRLAFHIDLLRWLNGLLLECKVSAQGFCEALKARQPKLYKELVTQEGKQIYKTLINETIHQFRQYIYQMDYCTDLFPDLDDGCSCPACFEADKNIYCFDADFQLVRKSSSGQHWISPKHKDHFFIEQQLVDDFISSYGSLKVDKECSDFQAGNDIRSKSKNQKLSETAVFGATCRHDFPQKFFSLKHGERLGYAVFLIQLLLKENKNDKIHVSYDIACMLKRHIEKAGNKEISQNVTFSIPIFHCYGHSASCQIIYGPRRTEGIGLTDGEGIERLWSYLGGFSNISKEMSPENRCDLLTDALIHYGRKIRDKQGEVLVMKIKRTIQLMETTKVALREILATVPELEIKDDTVMEWIEEEKRAVLSPNNSDSTLHLSKADEYVINLQRFFKISGHQSNEETSEEDKRLEKQLMIFEKKASFYQTYTNK
ncbi:uncharacterized protein [Mytilus edulis]|uniref:uncharacterized protein isoform X2 n=1 Tax=Mytilus edulis TaxID=6550 RepID=UPI0039EFB97C